MSLSGNVAQLMGDNIHKGTAWLISQEYALTALHCVQDETGFEFSNLNINFSHFNQAFSVKVVKKVKEMDIALLQIQEHECGDLPVISLSRREAQKSEHCSMYGYPGNIITALPNGVPIKGEIESIEAEYKGTNGKLNCRALQVGDLNVKPDQGSSNLQGLSGGPVVSNNQTSSHAMGVVIEELLGGNFIYVVPITEIATQIPEVHTAIQTSNYIDPQDPRLYVSLSEDEQNVRWSASVPPNQAAKLWESLLGNTSADSQTNINELYVSISLRQLKNASHALVRLCAYSNLKAIYVPDNEHWCRQEKKLKDHHRPPCHDLSLKPYQSMSPDFLPSIWIETSIEDFADTLHQVLDRFLLDWLNDQLYDCLDDGEDTELGCDIKPELSREMFEHWNQWYSTLKTNPSLLQCYLIRVFSLDSQCKGHDGVLMSIGFTPTIRKQLLHATLYALALSAAGVEIIPQSLDAGNISVHQQSGHVCGIDRSRRKRIDMIVMGQEWNTKVVILPYLNRQLLQSYEFAVPLTSVEGSKGHQLQNLPPVAITGDTAFLQALEMGKTAVKNYYDARNTEIDRISSTYKLPTRTESLDV